MVSADGFCDRDVDRRIGLAAGIVRNLQSIWKAKDISKSTKVLLYQSMVQSIVLYNSETWTIKEDQKPKLKTFEMAVLRKIMWNYKKKQKTECGHIEGTPDGGYQRSITDTPFDLLWACVSHGKGQISKYLDAWVHTWMTT